MKNTIQIIKFGVVCGALFISLFTSCENQEKNKLLIEVSSSGCFGTCPILDIKFKDEKIYYNLIFYNKKKGYFIYEPNPLEKTKLDSLLNSIEFDLLKNEYTSSRVDIPSFNVFIKVKEKNKRIHFYSDDAPKELENFINYLVELSNSELLKLQSPFSISTRMGMEIIKLSPPPLPSED